VHESDFPPHKRTGELGAFSSEPPNSRRERLNSGKKSANSLKESANSGREIGDSLPELVNSSEELTNFPPKTPQLNGQPERATSPARLSAAPK